jgi:hypothetical protein
MKEQKLDSNLAGDWKRLETAGGDNCGHQPGPAN